MPVEQSLAIGDVLLGAVRVRLVRCLRLAQVLPEAPNGLFVAVVLFVASALVVELDRIVATEVQLGEDLNTLGRIAIQAGALRGTFLCIAAGRLRGNDRDCQAKQQDRWFQLQRV